MYSNAQEDLDWGGKGGKGGGNEGVPKMVLARLHSSPVTIENLPDRDFGAGCQQAPEELPTSSQRLLCFIGRNSINPKV